MKTLLVIILSVFAFNVIADDKCKSCVAIRAMQTNSLALKAWGQNSKFWTQKSVLRVKFLTGKAGQKAEAWKRFQEIDNLVNLRFTQVTTGPSDIRVRFDSGQGHWSYLGVDCKTISSNQATMNLELKSGVFGDGKAEWDRVAKHEVLHAIGLEHEHQSPKAINLIWNKQAVYNYYASTQGWSKEQIDFQVLNRSKASRYTATDFDATSIMEYPIPPGLANITVGWNDKLSNNDIRFLQIIYPQ